MACTPVLPQPTNIALTGTQGNCPPVELLVPDGLRVFPDSVPEWSPRNIGQLYIRIAEAIRERKRFEPNFDDAMTVHKLLEAIQLTLSLKNSVGFVARSVRAGGHNYLGELHGSPYQRHMIAEINAAYTPSLIVMDGVDAFVDGGPATGKMVSPSVVIAGSDPVAMDAVGVAVLRLFGTTPQVSQGKVFAQEQIARAVELGLGIDSPEQIRIITGDAESEAYANLISQFLS